MGKWVDADAERRWIASHVSRGKVGSDALKAWLLANQKSGILVLDAPPSSPYPSRQLTIAETLTLIKAAGFSTVEQRLAVLAIAISESSLWSAQRNWHAADYGYRPITDVIGVPGPSTTWKDGRQAHSDRGICQISSHWWPQYTDLQCDTPAEAFSVMRAIYLETGTFNTWDPFRSGTAQRHYDEAFDGWPALRPLVT